MVNTGSAIVITIFVLAAVAAIGWVAYSRWQAQKLGLPPPSLTTFIPFLKRDHSSSAYGGPTPRSGGIGGWFGDQLHKFKNRNNRTAAGAYEGAGGGGGGRRGFGPLDPDDAWDARVGNEADTYGPGGYYEEQELGLHDHHHQQQQQQRSPYGARGDTSTAYGGGGGGVGLGVGVGGGADSYPMNLAATPRNDDGAERGRGTAARNPFDDDAAEPANISLRGVSPRPMEGEHGRGAREPDSPTGRRSIFTEQV